MGYRSVEVKILHGCLTDNQIPGSGCPVVLIAKNQRQEQLQPDDHWLTQRAVAVLG
jgi:hypothetical protein